MMYGFGHGYGLGFPGLFGGGAILMGVGLLFAAGLVIWLVYSLATRHDGVITPLGALQARANGPAGTSADPALDIVRERYARGEIDADQYAAIVADLGR